MIGPLVTELHSQIEEYSLLRRSASQASHIQATAKAAAKLRNDLVTWAAGYQATQLHFTAEQRQTLRRQADVLRSKLANSRDSFEGTYNQSAALSDAQDRARRLVDENQRYWAQYIKTQLDPLRTQMRLMRQLPKAQPQVTGLETLLRTLEGMAQHLPQSAQERTKFSSLMAALDEALHDVEAFTDEQKAFLDKIGSGMATLGDVTVELLNWSQQVGLAATLKISR